VLVNYEATGNVYVSICILLDGMFGENCVSFIHTLMCTCSICEYSEKHSIHSSILLTLLFITSVFEVLEQMLE